MYLVDGIPDKDKCTLDDILNQVSQQNAKDKSYYLGRHAYIYLQPDWPLYSDIEKKLMARLLTLTFWFSAKV